MNRILLLCLLMPLSNPGYALPPLKDQIQLLLNEINESDCQFIRNGKTHTPEKSVSHITRKYEHYEDDIDSIDSFIQLTATKSLMTGREYQVKCGDKTTSSANWLHGKATELGLNP